MAVKIQNGFANATDLILVLPAVLWDCIICFIDIAR